MSGNLGGVESDVRTSLRSGCGQPCALHPSGRHPDSGAVRVAGRHPDGSAVGGLDNAGGGARDRGVGLRYARRSCANSTLFGVGFGLFPIVWIVFNAIFIYNVIVDTGHFDTIRDSLARVSNDRRIQVVLIAFVFGALLEATAGFGTPVAITGSLMAGLGFEPITRRRWRCSRTRPPSPSGASASRSSPAAPCGPRPLDLSQMVGRQTPLSRPDHPGDARNGDGRFQADARGVAGSRGARNSPSPGTQFLVSNLLGPELADLLAALLTVVTVIALIAVWRPSRSGTSRTSPLRPSGRDFDTPPLGRTLYAWSPFIIIIALFLIVQIPPIKDTVGAIQTAVNFPTAVPSDTTGLPECALARPDEQVEQQPPVVAEPTPYSTPSSRPTGSRRPGPSS